MRPDEDVLRELNTRIGVAETEGDREFLAEVIGPVLAFRRANGVLVDRASFLDGVKPSARRETEVTSVTLHGTARALVTCTVTLVDGEQRREFDNVRLFVRADGGQWRLIAWANEPVEA